MKKIILATLGLAMFATPLAAQNPKASSHPDSFRSGPAFSSSSQALAVPQRPVVAPSGTTSSFGLAPRRTGAGFGYSTSGPWPHQEQAIRDRYGRTSRCSPLITKRRLRGSLLRGLPRFGSPPRWFTMT